MLIFLKTQILFYIAIGMVFFIPGYSFLFASKMKKKFSSLENFILAFGISIAIVDFLLITIGKLNIKINTFSVWTSLVLFTLLCIIIRILISRFGKQRKEEAIHKIKQFSPRHTLLIILLLFMTIFIKTIYFKDVIFPTSTDLGHHMYWTKVIITTGELPKYEKVDIGLDNKITKPAPIADFIIGEHLPFAAVSLLSGINLLSGYPIMILFLVQIMSAVAMLIAARELFISSKHADTIAITTLFFIGPLFTLTSPQAKFASGGVIGNTIGNFLIPLLIFLYVKALVEKKSNILSLALFISLGLAYTHHLSTFVFIFVFLFSAASFLFINFRNFSTHLKDWFKLIYNPAVLAVIFFGIFYVLFMYTPTYLNTHAINTAVGKPIKATRTGLTLNQLKQTAGDARFILAIIGLFTLLFAKKLNSYQRSFSLGWIISLTAMSLRPDLLFIDIPSNRIADYIVFPISIVSAYALVIIFNKFKNHQQQTLTLNHPLVLVIFFSGLIFLSSTGLYDNATALNTSQNSLGAVQTYAAASYLANNSNSSDTVLKDHNYLTGDSWIKLYFMRGYNYPLSRGYFKRYEDETKLREQCTNLMISVPNSDEAKKCFDASSVDFVMINPQMDTSQFVHLKNFWNVYSSDQASIYYKSL